MYDKKVLQKSNPYKSIKSGDKVTRTIYYGEVISVYDDSDGGRIKVRIELFDGEIPNKNLPWSYPLVPKFFHIYPKVGEMVRVLVEDIRYPERGRFWIGSIISQPHKLHFDSIYTSLSTTDMAVTRPDKAPHTYPESKGVFPEKEDVAIIGRKNTDVVLRENQLAIRCGKHENDDILKLNKKNPSSITLTYEKIDDEDVSSTIVLSDKIVLISHNGIPKFKANEYNINKEDREEMFLNAHPLPRGDVLIAALDIMRKAIINHVHGYSALSADKNNIINELEKINFTNILQKNILIN